MGVRNITVRQLASDFARDNPVLAVPERARGQCYLVACELRTLGAERGINSTIIEAYSPIGNHFAVAFPRMVVDATARQFDSLIDFPWVAKRGEWEWECLRWIGAIGFREIQPEP